MIPVRDVLPDAVASVLRQAPLCDEKVAFAWRFAVGPALGRASSVVLRETTLHVDARDATWRGEIERSRALVLRRLDAVLGRGIVTDLALQRPLVR